MDKLFSGTLAAHRNYSYFCGAFHTATLFFELRRRNVQSLLEDSWLGVTEKLVHEHDSVPGSSCADMPGQINEE